jgi:cytochrome c
MAGSLETNKLIGAVLTAGIIFVGSGVISDLLYKVDMPDENTFRIAGADESDIAEAVEAVPDVPLEVRLASASADAGQRAFRACAACHTADDGGANRVGPNLWDVVGRPIGGKEGFRYSAVIGGHGGVWDYHALDGFLAKPADWAPGTSMSYAGIADDAARADMIAYLRSLSSDPEPLPEAPAEDDSGSGR